MRGNKPKLKWKNDEATCGLIKLSVGVEDPLAKKVKVWWSAVPKVNDICPLAFERLVDPNGGGDLDWLKIKAEKWLYAQASKMTNQLKRD